MLEIELLEVFMQPSHVERASTCWRPQHQLTIPHWRDLHTLGEVSIITTPLDQ